MSDDARLREESQKFWQDFYNKSSAQNKPSPFAIWCQDNYLYNVKSVLELGCGNGRDSLYFNQKGIKILAVDGSNIAIDLLKERSARLGKDEDAVFFSIEFSEIFRLKKNFRDFFAQNTVAYSRFVLHSVPEKVEDVILSFATDVLPRSGRMFHEFRTIRDPLMRSGVQLGKNERMTDHYRRFIDPSVFRDKVKRLGWKELFFVESNGLAPFGNEDPVVARIVLEKV